MVGQMDTKHFGGYYIILCEFSVAGHNGLKSTTNAEFRNQSRSSGKVKTTILKVYHVMMAVIVKGQSRRIAISSNTAD